VKYDPAKHHRRSIRLKGYDYATPGAYFVTICVQNRECVLGEIVDGQMVLNDVGRITDQFWPAVANRFDNMVIHAWVTMPNHVHVIVVIGRGMVSMPNGDGMGGETGGETPPLHGWYRRGAVAAPTVAAPNGVETGGEMGGETPPLQTPVLGKIMAYFKYQTTRSVNQMCETQGVRFWQRNYWEHVIRNEADLNRIRQYVETNPVRWADDQLHPDAPPNRFNRG
jgi:putative transposase